MRFIVENVLRSISVLSIVIKWSMSVCICVWLCACLFAMAREIDRTKRSENSFRDRQKHVPVQMWLILNIWIKFLLVYVEIVISYIVSDLLKFNSDFSQNQFYNLRAMLKMWKVAHIYVKILTQDKLHDQNFCL